MNAATANTKPQGCTWLRLRKATRRITQIYDLHLRDSGLKITQFSLLAAFKGGETFSMSELAARMVMDRTTLTRNLKPLVDAGWVVLGCGDDARCRDIAITPAGRQAFEAAMPAWQAAEREIRRLIGGDDVASLHHILDHTLGLLETH